MENEQNGAEYDSISASIDESCTYDDNDEVSINRELNDKVHDSNEEQEFWMTQLDWVGIRLNQFEMFGQH